MLENEGGKKYDIATTAFGIERDISVGTDIFMNYIYLGIKICYVI